jgi:hypothetical protein
LFVDVGGASIPDGLTFSPNGVVLYVALIGPPSTLRAYDVPTAIQLFDQPIPGGVDGTAIGIGSLTGYIYGNTNDGHVYEFGLPLGPEPGVLRLIAEGGSRGDFIAIDPDVNCGGPPGFPSLLLTQTDRLVRLCAPPGAGLFGGPTSSTLRISGKSGACCLPANGCVSPLSDIECHAMSGGHFEGSGTTSCTHNPDGSCTTGACCLPNNGCAVDKTQEECVKLGGRYGGDGSTACYHDAAGGCIPTLSEWGVAVMAMLVLTAGTIVVMRRRAATA